MRDLLLVADDLVDHPLAVRLIVGHPHQSAEDRAHHRVDPRPDQCAAKAAQVESDERQDEEERRGPIQEADREDGDEADGQDGGQDSGLMRKSAAPMTATASKTDVRPSHSMPGARATVTTRLSQAETTESRTRNASPSGVGRSRRRAWAWAR